jgi:predicted naringenin-chalcone synthase
VTRRTEIQLALLIIGLAVWGYGARTEQPRLTWIGLGCFAAATALRFAKKRTQQ